MDIDGLIGLESPTRSLISLYYDPTTGPASSVLSELLKPIRAVGETLERDGALSVREDVDRIAGLKDRLGADAAGWCVFASSVDGIFEVAPVPRPVRNVATVQRRPYLRPLRALPKTHSGLVALVERPAVSLWRAGDELTGVGKLSTDLGKDNFGGFSGYDEAKASRHAEEESLRLWKEAGEVASDEHKRRSFGLVVVVGQQHLLARFVDQLHPYLRELPTFLITADPHTVTEAQLLEHYRGVLPQVRTALDDAMIERVLERINTDQPSATGAAVLHAVNLSAVEELVVCGPFTKDGTVCTDCDWLDRAAETCPSCGSDMEHVDDVIAVAMELAMSRGAHVRQVRTASQLDADGVAASLRFAVDG